MVYVPLQEDPNVPTTTTIVAHPLGTNETLVYQTMSLHAIYLTRNGDDQRPLHQYFITVGTGRVPILHRFDDMILNLSIDALINGRIAYTPTGTAAVIDLPSHAVSQIRILYCFVQYCSQAACAWVGMVLCAKKSIPDTSSQG